jgi:hypothetical protein
MAGSVQPEHLDTYLDEFVFRFNRRVQLSGVLSCQLLQQAVVTTGDLPRLWCEGLMFG